MLRSAKWHWIVLTAWTLITLAGPRTARADHAAVARCLSAAVSVDMKGADGKVLRTVNGTLVKEGLLVELSALNKATSAEVRARDGKHWTVQNALMAHPILGLALLEMPEVPGYALSFPESGAFYPNTHVTIMAGPGSSPDSVAATIFFTFALQEGTQFVAVYPGLPGAAPVIDPTGRLLGVESELSLGGINCWSTVPVVSVKAMVDARQAAQPIAAYNDVPLPAFEDGTTPFGLAFRGASLTTAEKNEDARTFFSAATKKDPKNLDAHFWLGRLLFSEQQYEQAAGEFQKAAAADSMYRLAWHMAGAAYNQAGKYLEAEKMYHKALQADPTSAESYCNLGGAYFNEHRYDKAVEAFRKSISLDPNYAQGLAYDNLAMTYYSQSKRAEAEGVYQDLKKVNADWAQKLRDMLDGKKTSK